MCMCRVGLIAALTTAALIAVQFGAQMTDAAPQDQTDQKHATIEPQEGSSQSTPSLELPISFERHVGDLDGMLKRREIRVLVVPSRTSFFYDRGQPHGIDFEAFDEFQRFVNQKYRSGALKTNITFIPLRPAQIERAILDGVGDVVGFQLIVTPERATKVLFTDALISDVKQVLVTGPKAPAINTLDDLSGKKVYVNPLSVYYESLQTLSASFQKAGKLPIIIKTVDPDLTDEDMLEMVSAGLLPITVARLRLAEFWSQVLPRLTVHPKIVVKQEGQAAWATRSDSPQLRNLLNEFIEGRAAGSSYGNILLRRYVQNTGWVKDASSTADMKKFQQFVRYFQKYAKQYDFDYLMLVAQGYQESGLDQSRRNPSGAVGIMQVIPADAAAPPISIPNVDVAESNINAGAKMLRYIADHYFDDPNLDSTNRTLMVFASYNAGPNRIARLRKVAEAEGLDPNKWFGNVELAVAKDVGQETVQYVSNIYKYYVAYKLILQESAPQN